MDKRDPLIRLREWPTEDWYYTHPLYRAIKTVAQRPIESLARVQHQGAEHIPREGGVVLAVNHFSWADPVLLGAALPRPAFYLAKERLFQNPLMRVFLEGMGQIKVDRVRGGNEDAIMKALEIIQSGCIVGVFPEGTRSRYGELKRGKTGVARIALLSGAPVVPVALDTARFWPKNRALPKLGESVYINIGKPMQFAMGPEAAGDRQTIRDVTDDIMAEVKRLLDEAQVAHERGDNWS